ncbi:heterokaryon incompatibility protein-domain-containing protein [Paraphoma chrysanthemicola]|nr:heterokaryon incompatibility protein-domain-containing protein [Paraphoma chrysanthemicola]
MVNADNAIPVADPQAWSDAELLQWHTFGKAFPLDRHADVKRLIDEGLNLNLQWPCFQEERLLNIRGRDVWIRVAADRCSSPLREAVRHGSARTVKLLLSSGADPNAESLDGATALHESLWASKSDIAVVLVEHGIELNREAMRDSSFGGEVTALQIAIRRMDFEMVKLLLKHGALPDARCLESALSNHDSGTIKLLSTYGGTPGFASLEHHDSWVEANWKADAFEGPNLPYDTIVGDLRKSLSTWLDRPVPANMASRDTICRYCYHLTSAELPDPALDITPVTLRTCPICRIISDEQLWWRRKTNNEGNTKQALNLRFAHEGYWGYDLDQKRPISVGYPSGHLAQILNKLQGCRDIGTESEGAIALARAWLLHCLTDHRKCSASVTSPPSLPTRVIDVGSSHQEPKLLQTGARPGIYCSLSYCWGKHPFLRTTKATLAKHQESIPLDELPKTLRDAILIARQLSIRYIWIDALCIVQDDLNDWAHESKLMASIYQNAILTIVAAAADDTTKGCFQPRSRNRVWPVKIPDEPSIRHRKLVLEPGEDGHDLSRDF